MWNSSSCITPLLNNILILRRYTNIYWKSFVLFMEIYVIFIAFYLLYINYYNFFQYIKVLVIWLYKRIKQNLAMRDSAKTKGNRCIQSCCFINEQILKLEYSDIRVYCASVFVLFSKFRVTLYYLLQKFLFLLLHWSSVYFFTSPVISIFTVDPVIRKVIIFHIFLFSVLWLVTDIQAFSEFIFKMLAQI